jgi:hypothetical protein
MTTETKLDELTTQCWIYLGRRRNGTEVVDAYVRTRSADAVIGDPPADMVLFDADRSLRVVGGIYEVLARPDGSRARLAGATYKGRHNDAEQVLAWKAESDAVDVAVRAAAAEKRAKVESLEGLEPLRKAYQRLIGRDRIALELVVLSYLRTGRKS